jgi:hypothetical protein
MCEFVLLLGTIVGSGVGIGGCPGTGGCLGTRDWLVDEAFAGVSLEAIPDMEFMNGLKVGMDFGEPACVGGIGIELGKGRG